MNDDHINDENYLDNENQKSQTEIEIKLATIVKSKAKSKRISTKDQRNTWLTSNAYSKLASMQSDRDLLEVHTILPPTLHRFMPVSRMCHPLNTLNHLNRISMTFAIFIVTV